MEQATFDDFMKLDIRVGTIVEARPFEKARKPAYQLLVDLGPELGRKRSSAQITQQYTPEELVGKTLIAITNLPPRKMMGIDSCGMIISAIHHEEGVEKLHCLMVDDHIPAGAKLY